MATLESRIAALEMIIVEPTDTEELSALTRDERAEYRAFEPMRTEGMSDEKIRRRIYLLEKIIAAQPTPRPKDDFPELTTEESEDFRTLTSLDIAALTSEQFARCKRLTTKLCSLRGYFSPQT